MVTKAEQIKCQIEVIDRLRAENASLRRKCERSEKGRQQLLVMFTTTEPPEADDWADMVRQAQAEIESEHG